MLVDLRRLLHVQLTPDGLLGKGLHGIHRTILGKHLAIRVRHLFGKGRHELGVGSAIWAWTGSVVARYAAEERTAARTLSAIASSSAVGCRPLSEKLRSICAVTARSWSWAASIRAKAAAAERTAVVQLSPAATAEEHVAAATQEATTTVWATLAARLQIEAALMHLVSTRMTAAAALSPEWAAKVSLATRVHVPIFNR